METNVGILTMGLYFPPSINNWVGYIKLLKTIIGFLIMYAFSRHMFDPWLGQTKDFKSGINPFPHIDAFWRLCSRRLFENIVTKEEIAQNEQFLLLPQIFPLIVIGYPFNYRYFLLFDKICPKSSAAELFYQGKE